MTERMFPEPKEFIKVDKFVIKDSKGFYDRYWNNDLNKWTGLIQATRFTKEEADNFTKPENGELVNYNDLLKVKPKKVDPINFI